MRDQSHDYPAFPEIEAELGYNPSRFLDHEIETTSCTADLTVTALIRGLDDIETIRAWIEVEVDLERDNGGPRREIITQLNRRQLQIEEASAPSTTKNDRATTSAPTEESTVANAERARDEESSEPAPDAPETASNGAATPHCSDCRAELTPEEVGDETAHWCAHCGGFRDPLGGASA